MKVADIMSSQPVTLTEQDNADTAAKLMEKHNIGSLPVVNGQELRGIITDRDIVLRCVAKGQEPSRTNAAEIMSPYVASVSSDESIGVALNMMGEYQVQRLPVVDNGKLCGMLSLSDIARQRIYDEVSEAVAEIKSVY